MSEAQPEPTAPPGDLVLSNEVPPPPCRYIIPDPEAVPVSGVSTATESPSGTLECFHEGARRLAEFFKEKGIADYTENKRCSAEERAARRQFYTRLLECAGRYQAAVQRLRKTGPEPGGLIPGGLPEAVLENIEYQLNLL
jgi:hypothetical protein